MRFKLALLALIAIPFLPLAASAQQAFKEGVHYTRIDPPVRPSVADKIEVVELFAYSCPHCLNFEPLLDAWERKSKPADVVLVRMPAIWAAPMEPLARGFYTAQALKITEKAHGLAFKAVQADRRRMDKPEDWGDLFAPLGVDRQKVIDTFKSFTVATEVKKAEKLVRDYQISGTPEMVVAGKYRVDANKTGGHEGMLKVVDFLVAQERAAKK